MFALAWSMCFVLYGVPAAFGQSLVAHGVREPHRLTERHRRILLSSLALLGPVVAVILVFAPLFLLPFGAWYASQGAGTVRLLALSALPNAVVALTVSRARVERDMVTVVVTMVGLAVVVLGLTLLLVPLMGIAGGGMAWLTGQLLVAGGIGLRRLRLVLVGCLGRACPTVPDGARSLWHVNPAGGWTGRCGPSRTRPSSFAPRPAGLLC